MAPRGAPSPGRRRPPISPAPSPACPARLRRGALRGGLRTRGPAGRLPVICPCLLLSRCPQDNGEPQFSLCPAGRTEAGPPRDPSLAKGVRASELRASASQSPYGLAPDCHLLWLPPSSPAAAPAGPFAALSARRVGAQPRRADLASDPVQRGESGSGVADPETKRGGERGKGRGKGGGGQWLGAEPPPPLHHPRPSLPFHSRHRPRPRAPPLQGVAWRAHSLCGWSAAPPSTRFGWGSSHPNSPWLLPNLPLPRRPLILRAPRPSPQTPALNCLPQFGQRAAPLFVPGPGHGWWVGARGRGEGRSAVLGWGRGRVTEATPGVCSVRARSERRAPGEQVPVARRAHEQASEQRP